MQSVLGVILLQFTCVTSPFGTSTDEDRPMLKPTEIIGNLIIYFLKLNDAGVTE